MTRFKTLNYKILGVILAIMLVISLAAPFAAIAESSGKIIVHFYNSAGYDCEGGYSWGAYYWLDRSNTVLPTGVDENFCNEKVNPELKGLTYELTLGANDIAALKGGKELGLIMVWAKEDGNYIKPNWGTKDVSIDRMVKVNFDNNNVAHLYTIAGDESTYKTIEDAKTAFERIESVKFDSIGVVDVQTTGDITERNTATLLRHYFEDGNEKTQVIAEGVTPQKDGNHSRRGRYNFTQVNESSFDIRSTYEVKIEGYAYNMTVDKTRLFISPYFKNNFEPAINGENGIRREYGALYSKESTTFRVWAPISKRAILNLYRSGDPKDTSIYASPIEMTYTTKGVWETTVKGNLDGIYYTYTFHTDGKIIETIDVNAYSSGINGDRGYIFDLKALSPNGWDLDYTKSNEIRNKHISDPDPVIWEIHVRDFSIHVDSGIKYKGKYLGFTEEGTTVKGNSSIKTGIDHIKELGVSYVHILPIYDFDKVDESKTGDPAYDGKFNWGYDPKNYNIPEGSYSTNPYDGAVRVMEFKQMVQSLHNAGIGVIMDMVYNHTFNMSAPLNKTVPNYYYRQQLLYEGGKIVMGSYNFPAYKLDVMGNYVVSNGSGCGNETASEREMFGQYMRTSVMHWAENMHIDGFRFDLMKIHNIGTMNAIRDDLNKKFDGAGKGVLMYGEPWAAADIALVSNTDPSTWPASNDTANLKALSDGIYCFNDKIRDALKGGNGETDGYLPGGYVTGQVAKADDVLYGLQGNYSGVFGKSITYTSAHDNYMLNDHLLASMMHSDDRTSAVYSYGNAQLNNMSKLTAALSLTAKGTHFIASGDEFGRTKFGNHNSYDSSDKVNAMDYARKTVKADLYEYYKGLIQLRKSFSPMRDKAGTATMETANYDNSGVIKYVYTKGAKVGDKFTQLAVIANPNSTAYDCKDASFNGWYVIGMQKIDLNSTEQVGTSFKVPARTALILAKK